MRLSVEVSAFFRKDRSAWEMLRLTSQSHGTDMTYMCHV